MTDYFHEMGWQMLGPGEAPNQLLHLARLLRDMGAWDLFYHDQELSPPASKTAINELKERKISEPGSQCPVCLKDNEVGEVLKILPCEHEFHDSCILLWLEKTNTCPICRHELPTDNEDYELFRKEKLRAKEREEDLKTLHDSMFS